MVETIWISERYGRKEWLAGVNAKNCCYESIFTEKKKSMKKLLKCLAIFLLLPAIIQSGGMTPSGWIAESLPYLLEFDNWGSSGSGGTDAGDIWIWGWDEICWFARLEENERNGWLAYAY